MYLQNNLEICVPKKKPSNHKVVMIPRVWDRAATRDGKLDWTVGQPNRTEPIGAVFNRIFNVFLVFDIEKPATGRFGSIW